MTTEEIKGKLRELLNLPQETEWVEFKVNHANPQEIGEYISALSNSACLHQKEAGYAIWGIEDGTHQVIGTDFKPRQSKKGNEELENWLAKLLDPRINFEIHEFSLEDKPIVLLKIQPASHRPVSFSGREYIRIGSYKKSLRDFPEKERAIWAQFGKASFEKLIAAEGRSGDEALELLDYPSYFKLTEQNLPDKNAILERFVKEKLLVHKGTKYNITNLGAILFAKALPDFEEMERKAVRVIVYKGDNRTETINEKVGVKGYAAGFEGLISYINDLLPQNEVIEQALRRKVRVYPELAIRELVANAIIHQDFGMMGDSPMIEIFSDRIEITNSGKPLIDTMRFIDEPPQSRNETLASLMRRLAICEERGSGIDKVISQAEIYQLPGPEFRVTENHTKAILFAPQKLNKMDKKDKIRACYQHACLLNVSNKQMTNATLRARFGIADKNYTLASKIISDTFNEKLIKYYDPESKSKKLAKYVPFWA